MPQGLRPEQLLQDRKVARHGEIPCRFPVVEQVADLLETTPGKGRGAHGARLVGAEEDGFPRVRPVRQTVERMDRGRFPVEGGILLPAVAARYHHVQVRPGEHRRPE